MQCADNGCRAHPESDQQADADYDFDETHHVAEQNWMRKNNRGQESFVEANGLALHEAGDVLLETAVGKGGGEEFVLSEEDKDDGRQDADKGDRFLQRTGNSRHTL